MTFIQLYTCTCTTDYLFRLVGKCPTCDFTLGGNCPSFNFLWGADVVVYI